MVNFHHSHNIVDAKKVGGDRKFGIRVTLPASDTLVKVLGSDWERLHWYLNEQQRDAAFDDMATRHGYYRETDTPTQTLEKVSR